MVVFGWIRYLPYIRKGAPFAFGDRRRHTAKRRCGDNTYCVSCFCSSKGMDGKRTLWCQSINLLNVPGKVLGTVFFWEITLRNYFEKWEPVRSLSRIKELWGIGKAAAERLCGDAEKRSRLQIHLRMHCKSQSETWMKLTVVCFSLKRSAKTTKKLCFRTNILYLSILLYLDALFEARISKRGFAGLKNNVQWRLRLMSE